MISRLWQMPFSLLTGSYLVTGIDLGALPLSNKPQWK